MVVFYCDLYEDYAYDTIRYGILGGGSAGITNYAGAFEIYISRDYTNCHWYIGCYKEWYCDMGGFANVFAYYATGGSIWYSEYKCGGFLFWLFAITDYDTTIGCALL